jgi:hypothetical protein
VQEIIHVRCRRGRSCWSRTSHPDQLMHPHCFAWVRPSISGRVIPRGGEVDKASGCLLQNERWVLDQLEFVERSSGALRRSTSSSSLLLRVEERAIRIVKEETTRRYGLVFEHGDALTVRVPRGREDLVARALELWLRASPLPPSTLRTSPARLSPPPI